MEMVLKSGIFAVFLAILVPSNIGFKLQTVVDLVGVSKDVVIGLEKVWDIVENQMDAEMPLPMVDKAERRLFRKINKINTRLDDLSSKVDNVGANTIAALLHTVPERMRLELRLNDLYDYLTRVDVIYSRMEDYVKATHKYERLTLEDFAKSIISHDGSSVINLMERIHTFLVPHGEGLVTSGILGLLVKSFQVRRGSVTQKINRYNLKENRKWILDLTLRTWKIFYVFLFQITTLNYADNLL
ncbi:hypothetical protein HHI36_014519 [Cryptolaemus montrouzieri]|uniref:Uncharacterized protein n=1 Tax=Cryptolaemus montrouzieri TaxID=559131 RepID=A0ABD2N413_9CUCU